jgi:hypothetical protein
MIHKSQSWRGDSKNRPINKKLHMPTPTSYGVWTFIYTLALIPSRTSVSKWIGQSAAGYV